VAASQLSPSSHGFAVDVDTPAGRIGRLESAVSGFSGVALMGMLGEPSSSVAVPVHPTSETQHCWPTRRLSRSASQSWKLFNEPLRGATPTIANLVHQDATLKLITTPGRRAVRGREGTLSYMGQIERRMIVATFESIESAGSDAVFAVGRMQRQNSDHSLSDTPAY